MTSASYQNNQTAFTNVQPSQCKNLQTKKQSVNNRGKHYFNIFCPTVGFLLSLALEEAEFMDQVGIR